MWPNGCRWLKHTGSNSQPPADKSVECEHISVTSVNIISNIVAIYSMTHRIIQRYRLKFNKYHFSENDNKEKSTVNRKNVQNALHRLFR